MEKTELIKLLNKGNRKKLVAALAPLDDKQRRALSKTASEWNRFFEQIRWSDKSARIQKKIAELEELGIKLGGFEEGRRDSVIAVLGCCPLSKVKELRVPFPHHEESLHIQVLKDRNPEWFGEFIEHCLVMRDGWQRTDWPLVNEFVTGGFCEKPTSDNYILSIARLKWLSHDESEYGKVIKKLEASEGFFESDVLRLFDIESEAFVQMGAGPTWGKQFHDWIDEGKLDRQKVIAASLRSLSHRLTKPVMSGFAKFFDSLEATPDELTESVDDLGALLGSEVPIVAKVALGCFKEFHKSRSIDSERILRLLPTIFDGSTKAPPKSALSFVGTIARKEKESVPEALNTTVEALRNPHADVQEKALSMIEKWLDRAHRDHAIAIQQKLEDLSPAVVPQAKAIIAAISGDESGVSQSSTDDVVFDVAELTQQVAEVDDRWRELLQLDQLVAEFDQPEFPLPLHYSIAEVPVLSGVDPVEPMNSTEELIDAVAHAVESVASAMEAELLLDAATRLAISPNNEEWRERVDPIAKRVAAVARGEGVRGFTSAMDAPTNQSRELLFLALGIKSQSDSTSRPTASADEHLSDTSAHSGFHLMRLDELIGELKQSQGGSYEMLSTPTHERGWIDPLVFVDRLNRGGNVVACRNDLVLALLRLAPENRRAAFEGLRIGDKAWGQLLKIVLNQDVSDIKCRDGINELIDAELVNLAAHVRTRPLSDGEIEMLNADKQTANGRSPLKIAWRCSSSRLQFCDNEGANSHYRPHFDRSPYKELFWFLNGKHRLWQYGSGWRFQQDDWNSKLSNDHYLLCAANRLNWRLEDNSSMFDPNSEMLEALFEPDRPWSEIAHLTALMSLVGKDKDALGVGIDATIFGIEQGLADPHLTGLVLTKLFEAWSKHGRLAKSLAEVSRISPLHRWFVVVTLEPLIATFDPMPRDAAKILEVYLESLTALQLAPSEAVCVVLRGVKGSGKSAKLSKKIVAIQTEQSSSARTEAKLLAFQSRLDRAARWSSVSRREN